MAKYQRIFRFLHSQKEGYMKKVLICGAGGFIGGHLVKKLKRQGHWVRGVDLKMHEYSKSPADEFIIGDLTEQSFVKKCVDQPFDEIYQLAADMGGAGYIFTGENDANVMHNSAMVNLNIIQQAKDDKKVRQVLKSNDHTAPTLPARLRRKQPARQAKK